MDARIPALARGLLAVLLALSIPLGAASAAGKGSAPSSSMTRSGGCETAVYVWSDFRRAHTAAIHVHHFGIHEATRRRAALGPSGSFGLAETDLVFVPGDQYTILGVLEDPSGKPITPSGAVWWGIC